MPIRPLADADIDALGALLATEKAAAGCWCMWFIRPVKDYHAAGAAGNRAAFTDLLRASALPMGVVAEDDGALVGWCAVGPRSRYARAIRTPTYKAHGPAPGDDADTVWLVPCLFVRKEARGRGLSTQLVQAAVDLARAHGATAVDAFPLAGPGRHARDTQVGFEPVFSACGFTTIGRPSSSRAVMRRASTASP